MKYIVKETYQTELTFEVEASSEEVALAKVEMMEEVDAHHNAVDRPLVGLEPWCRFAELRTEKQYTICEEVQVKDNTNDDGQTKKI